jgi:hypothetical protein
MVINFLGLWLSNSVHIPYVHMLDIMLIGFILYKPIMMHTFPADVVAYGKIQNQKMNVRDMYLWLCNVCGAKLTPCILLGLWYT